METKGGAFVRDRDRATNLVLDALRAVRTDKGDTFRISADALYKFISVADSEAKPSRATVYRIVGQLSLGPTKVDSDEELTVTRSGRGNYLYSFVGATSIDDDLPQNGHRQAPILIRIDKLIDRNRQLEAELAQARKTLSAQAIHIERLQRGQETMAEVERRFAGMKL